MLASLALMALALPLLAVWGLTTESGRDVVLGIAAHASAGRLSFGPAQGTLTGSLFLSEVRWEETGKTPAQTESSAAPHPGAFRLVLRDVRLTWRAFWRDRVQIAELSAGLVDIVSPPSETPPALPEDLSLPVGLVVESLRVDLLEWRDAEKATPLSVAAIKARLESDGARHHIEILSLSLERLHAGGSVALEGKAPFKLDAHAKIEGGGEYPFQLALAAAGALEKFDLSVKAGGVVRGEGTARIETLAPMPLAAADLKLFGIDPAAWVEGAPRAALDVIAHITPEASADAGKGTPPASEGPKFTADLSVENRAPGTIDAGALPLASLRLRLSGDAQKISFSDTRAVLRGGGRIEGNGRFEAGELDFNGRAQDIDARALDTRLQTTRLSGTLRYSHSGRGEMLETSLNDPRFSPPFSISTRLHYHEQDLKIESLTLAAQEARLSAAGQFRLAAPRRFFLDGQLEHFDPSRFVQAPAADLSARIKAEGALDPGLSVALDFAFDPSTFDRQKVGGGGRLRLTPERVSDSDFTLELGENKLSVRGAFGAPGDLLKLALDAPHLNLFGTSGAGNARLDIGGTRAQPAANLSLSVPRLRLPDGTQLSHLSAGGHLEAGNEGALQLDLALEELSGPDKRTLANAVTLSAEGKRNAQTWQLNARLPAAWAPDPWQLALALEGGFDPKGQWQGILKRADFGRFAPCRAAENGDKTARQMNGLSLGAPASLSWRENTLSLEAANFEAGEFSPCGEAKKSGARDYSPGRIEIGLLRLGKDIVSHGRLSQLPVGWLNSAAGTLRFNGDWDLNLAADALSGKPSGAVGHARLEYAGGRLLPEQSTVIKTQRGTEIQAPDIKALSADLNIRENRVSASAKLVGGNDGVIDGALELTLDPQRNWGLKRDAAWKGSLNIALPSLAGTGPLFDPNLRIRGSVSGALQLGGTPAAPALSGALAGNDLSLRRVDFGTDLREGRIVLALDNHRLRLDQFRFDSLLGQKARDPRIDFASLSATPGKISASGEMDLIGGHGDLSWEFERFGVLQKPDQWLTLSGKGDVSFSEKHFGLKGRIVADAGYFELPSATAPKLGDDVVVRGREAEKNPPIPFDLELEADPGRALWFHGAGVDTRLTGNLRITAKAADKTGALSSQGTIRAADGTFNAYGVKLVLERGIFTFNGPIDNPALSIRAVRRNQPVEAGVEVSGTVRKPQVKLVSSPNVPDTEKLSWMILGRAPETDAGGDMALLLSAAGDLFGEGSGTAREMQRALGIDEIGVRSGTLGGQDSTDTSRVASTQGFSGSSANTEQLVTVGKRLSANTTLAYEQSLASAGSIIKLTLQLSRSLSLVGRAGSDNALDLYYLFSFGKDSGKQTPARESAGQEP
ncbi:MAG: translocation/assembly module TamB domain-containing protein [Betaproteobacteria bacterium]|nr:translocation/assembly module TamB domain-containing protein [Betaproteobacteria bacterium]